MKAWWGLCALACAASASARSGFEAQCEAKLGRPKAELVMKGAGFSVDNSLSIAELTRREGLPVGPQVVLGLTRARSQVSIDWAGRVLTDRKRGRECMVPRVDVQLGYTPIVIHVGSEFKPGTCAYEAVLAHEKRHMALFLENLDAAGKTLRATFAARLGTKPVHAKRGTAFDALGRDIDEHWLPLAKAELARADEAQAAIDTAEEFDRLSKLCEGEVQSIIDNRVPPGDAQWKEE